MATTNKVLKERRDAGIALLNTSVPDWYNRINTDVLNLFYEDSCVLGQLYCGEYTEGLHALHLTAEAAVAKGFAILPSPGQWEEYIRLTNMWKEAIITTRKENTYADE